MIGAINDNFGTLGYVIVGIFVVSWLVSLLVYRAKVRDEVAVRPSFDRRLQVQPRRSSSSEEGRCPVAFQVLAQHRKQRWRGLSAGSWGGSSSRTVGEMRDSQN
jgi:hypothetical protein